MGREFKERFRSQLMHASRLAGGVEAISYSALLRTCIDPWCHEWNETDIEEKLSAFSIMHRLTGLPVESLVHDCINFCNREADKNISEEDMVIALCRILSYTIDKITMDESGG